MDNSKIRYMIIDDEPIAHRIIKDYCAAVPHLMLVNDSFDALEAMEYLANHQVELMFLDINMPKLKGFDFLKTLSCRPKVIVTTAYQEYAIEGYELNVCDYLLKPFSFERCLNAINKATAQIAATQSVQNQSSLQQEPATSTESINQDIANLRIFVKGDKQHHQIRLAEIYYIEACGNYCLIYLKDRKIITHQKISAFTADLPDELFMRVHKSYIVALDKISSISTNVIHIKKVEIPIGQTYKSQVVSLIAD